MFLILAHRYLIISLILFRVFPLFEALVLSLGISCLLTCVQSDSDQACGC